MKKTGKYEIPNDFEGEFEPGSKKRVLRNLLGVKRKRQMDALEFNSLEKQCSMLSKILVPNILFQVMIFAIFISIGW